MNAIDVSSETKETASEANARNTITKPEETNVLGGPLRTDYVSFIEQLMKDVKEEGYHPQYVVGVSFGASLYKWRQILSTIFNNETGDIVFNEMKRFENALLITDPVYVKDEGGYRDLQAEKLQIWTAGTSDSYLHTKFILLHLQNNKQENKYILLVSSKNISNSNNCDIIVPLYSDTPGNVNHKSVKPAGEQLKEYLCFLTNSEEKKEFLNLPDLVKFDFQVKNEEGEFRATVTDFAISYGKSNEQGHRFSEELWKELLLSQIIISPYLTADQIKELRSVEKILSYQQTFEKILGSESANQDNCDAKKKLENKKLYVGAPKEKSGRYKFHAKMYVRKLENKNTKLFFGSANLTAAARGKHYEMLIGVEFKDSGNLYDYFINQIVNNKNAWIKEYETGCDLGEFEEPDDESDNIPNRMSKYALRKLGDNQYQWDVFTISSNGESEKVSAKSPIKKADIGHWIECDEHDVFICRENYMEGYVSYDDFLEIINENVKAQKNDYYQKIFNDYKKKKRKAEKDGSRNSEGKSGKKVKKYPCLYRMLQEQCPNDADDVKKELQNFYDSKVDGKTDSDNEIVEILGEIV